MSQKVPVNVPVDWFDPSFFNESLDVLQRCDYIDTGVAIPLPDQVGATLRDHRIWKNLKTREFMERFGDAVLQKYDLLTPEEIEQAEKYEFGADGDDEDEEDDGNEENESEPRASTSGVDN